MSPLGAQTALAARARAVPAADPAAAKQATARLRGLAVPPDSLASLGGFAVRLAAGAGRCPPPVPVRPVLVVAAADHGVHVRGVSPWPQAITAAMAGALCRGKASANAVARAVGAEVWVLDAGLVGDAPDHPRLRRAGVRRGTADLTAGPALSRTEATRAVLAGVQTADEALADGADLLATGDMGIANTTPAACLIAALTGRPAAEVTGPGAAGPRADLAAKRALVAAAVRSHQTSPEDPIGVLASFGGLEHAALAGVCLAGAAARVPVVLDGVSSLAAALLAVAIAPSTIGHLIAGHRSPEPGAAVCLASLGLVPVLDLGLRVGEGTGGLLAVPVVVAAARVLTDVVALDDVVPPGGEVLSTGTSPVR